MDMIQYRYVLHKASSNIFSLKILMSKMHLALVNQSQNSLTIGKGWIQKKAQCLPHDLTLKNLMNRISLAISI